MALPAKTCLRCRWPFPPRGPEQIWCDECLLFRRENSKKVMEDSTVIETLKDLPPIGITPKCGFDTVYKPRHYAMEELNGVECIDASRAIFGEEAVRTHAHIVAFEYVWRAKNKNGDEDLKKAIWWLRVAVGEDPRK